MTGPVAIVGAGIAGLAAARALRMAGVAVTLFDKGRGLGGRMATRRIENRQFDHGVQYIRARGPRFQALLAEWQAAGHVAPWFEDAVVGTPGMTAPARAMAAGQAVMTSTEIRTLSRGSAGWTVATAEGAVDAPDNGRFETVILAVPAPQALTLAKTAGASLPAIGEARYHPCWALMLAFADRVDLGSDRIHGEDGTIAWIARDGSKPGRPKDGDTVVVHATPEWSTANLERTADAIAIDLTDAFQAMTGVRAAPIYASAHRWRYALVERPIGQAYLWDPEARIGACGDWCLGSTVEHAFDSGEAMAGAVSR